MCLLMVRGGIIGRLSPELYAFDGFGSLGAGLYFR
jgi:hypothetical protein